MCREIIRDVRDENLQKHSTVDSDMAFINPLYFSRSVVICGRDHPCKIEKLSSYSVSVRCVKDGRFFRRDSHLESRSGEPISRCVIFSGGSGRRPVATVCRMLS